MEILSSLNAQTMIQIVCLLFQLLAQVMVVVACIWIDYKFHYNQSNLKARRYIRLVGIGYAVFTIIQIVVIVILEI